MSCTIRPASFPQRAFGAGRLLVAVVLAAAAHSAGLGAEPASAADVTGDRRPARLLLLGQSPDGHPWSTHEYMDGVRLIGSSLASEPGIRTIVVRADSPWVDGPELLDGADGAVLFLSEGARWLGEDRSRLHAFQRLAARGGGLVCLHWAMGCRGAGPINPFIQLFGGCHGGPDRKYRVLRTRLSPASARNPISRGIAPFDVEDEFYYRLKFADRGTVIPVLQAKIDGKPETVAWAFERSDGGRSFGFSGFHFHRNWKLLEYRRLIVQGILWTLKRPIPPAGAAVEVSESELTLRRPKPEGGR